MTANAIFSKFARDYMALKKVLPIRPSEMAVLNIIIQHPTPHTPLMIAERLGVSKSMVTAHIRALEKDGYIQKEASGKDKRSFYVLPTAKAKELADRFNTSQIAHLKRMEQALGCADFDRLTALLDCAQKTLETVKEN